MSVLDRAIVKAFERMRVTGPAERSSVGTETTDDRVRSAESSVREAIERALHTLEAAAREDVVAAIAADVVLPVESAAQNAVHYPAPAWTPTGPGGGSLPDYRRFGDVVTADTDVVPSDFAIDTDAAPTSNNTVPGDTRVLDALETLHADNTDKSPDANTPSAVHRESLTDNSPADCATSLAPPEAIATLPNETSSAVASPDQVPEAGDLASATVGHEVNSTVAAAQAAVEITPDETASASAVQAPLPETVDWKWPEICEQLDQFTGDGFRQLAKHLQVAAMQGNQVLAFVASTPTTGRTSVVLTLTRILALEGRSRVLLIDADRRHPDLARLTGFEPQVGVCEVAHAQAELTRALVVRKPGLVSLLPLRTPVSDAEWIRVAPALRSIIQQARSDYDLILIDAGVFGPETRLGDCWLRGATDAVITIARQLNNSGSHAVLNWKQIGIESLGVIETFS